MKIVHICLANYYMEGMGYQENILPYYHVKFGHQVIIFTPQSVFCNINSNSCAADNEYVNTYGATVKAIKSRKRCRYYSKFKDYENLYNELDYVKPDIIFVHGGQFVAFRDVIKYIKRHRNTKMYVDQHADYYNTPVNTLKARLAATLLYGHWMRKASKYVERFWGVTPWRCQYLKDIYNIPADKVDLLTMGGDDDKIKFDQKHQIRYTLREALDISQDDFVVITGGKINEAKNIHLLMHAVNNMSNKQIKLVVFGQIVSDIKKEVIELSKSSNIRYIGWLPADKVYDYFLMADLAVFPGTHSVLWEQACACGLPGVFKDWVGMRHVNVNGNCEFLYEDSVDEIKSKISKIYSDKDYYDKMKNAAENCKKEFFYSEISKKSIS